MCGIKGMWCCELQTRLMIISRKIISADHKHVFSIALGNIFPLQITFKSSQLAFIILVKTKFFFFFFKYVKYISSIKKISDEQRVSK